MPEIILTPELREVLEADHERRVQAGWLALSELGPEPDQIKDWGRFCDWVSAVNRRAEEIFRRLN